MNDRLELHDVLTSILGSKFVYFQPPESVKLTYPCIIYELNNVDIKHANNKPYISTKGYSVTVIDKDPDSFIPDMIRSLALCSFDRYYTADNLNHWVFTLFY